MKKKMNDDEEYNEILYTEINDINSVNDIFDSTKNPSNRLSLDLH